MSFRDNSESIKKFLAAHIWMPESIKLKMEYDGIFKSVLAQLPFKSLEAFSGSFGPSSSIGFLRAVAPKLEAAAKLLSKKADAGFGYSIELKGEFVYQLEFSGHFIHEERHPMLCLNLVNQEGGVAGSLGFRLGLPTTITLIQGDNFQNSRKFFNDSNGKTFDIALLSHFINCMGQAAYFPRGDPLRGIPNGEFSLRAAEQISKRNPAMLKRLSQYVHDGDKDLFVRGDTIAGAIFNGKGNVPIRGELFTRAWNTSQQQLRAQKPIAR